MIALKVRTDRFDSQGGRVYDTYALDRKYSVSTIDIAEALGCRSIDVRVLMSCFGVEPTIYVEVTK